LQELTDEFVRRDDVIAAMRKVRVTTTDEVMRSMPFAPDDRVSVRLVNGETISHEPVVHAKGSWQKPMSTQELRDKFLDCCGTRLPGEQAQHLFEKLMDLERLPSLQRLPLTVN